MPRRKLGPGQRWPRAEPHVAEFDRAAQLVRDGKLMEAEALYRELARMDVAAAETALYLLARLEARNLKKPEQAMGVLKEMERRFPNGSLKRERALSLIEALVALGRCDEAKQALGRDPGLSMEIDLASANCP
ncbi:MAG: hypothetical protein QM765_18025 [Myxococcales bacterium]